MTVAGWVQAVGFAALGIVVGVGVFYLLFLCAAFFYSR